MTTTLKTVAPPLFEHSLEMAEMVQQHYQTMGYGCKVDRVRDDLYQVTVFRLVEDE